MKQGDKKFICENKRWRVDTKIYFGDGTYKAVNKRWFATKADAKTWFAKYEQEQIAEHDLTGEQSWTKFYREWLGYRETKVKATTAFTSDKSYYVTFIKPFVEGKTVSQAFDQSNAIAIYENIKRHDCGVARKNGAIAIYLSMLEYAYDLLYIGDRQHQLCRVRMQKLKAPARGRKVSEKRIPWTEEEESQFLTSLGEGTKEWIMFSFFLHVGLRKAEFLALKVGDVDFDRLTLTVGHQMTYEGTGRATYSDNLKSSNSYRDVPISKEDADMIRGWVEANGLCDDDFLWFSPVDRRQPYSKNAFEHLWVTRVSKSGVRYMVPHGARHIISTRGSERATSIHEQILVSQMLGHKPSVDIDVYGNHGSVEEMRALIK